MIHIQIRYWGQFWLKWLNYLIISEITFTNAVIVKAHKKQSLFSFLVSLKRSIYENTLCINCTQISSFHITPDISDRHFYSKIAVGQNYIKRHMLQHQTDCMACLHLLQCILWMCLLKVLDLIYLDRYGWNNWEAVTKSLCMEHITHRHRALKTKPYDTK